MKDEGNDNGGLDEYARKRNFKKTPEPPPRKPFANEKRPCVFVVQRHASRTLHYDLRLEMEGVLKSWAVPKGPSLDPAQKRLAVAVEDHPLEYAGFEGIIPKGEYGAGTVMVWDKGTWSAGQSPAQGLQRGLLKFRLYGARLKGLWALVRLKKGAGGKDEWLLVKEDDEEARPGGGDILEELPYSAATGRRIEEITGAPEALWSPQKGFEPLLPPGARLMGAIPAVIRPQLAALAQRPPAGDDWLNEIKFDGYRILARVSGLAVRLFTRNSRDWTEKFPSIARAIKELPLKDAWLDGEAVFIKEDGRSSFGALQDALSRSTDSGLSYYIFDIPFYEGYDLTGVPLIERKRLAAFLLASPGSEKKILRYSEHAEGDAGEFFKKACALGLEGIISKRSGSFYRQTRTSSWLKVKCRFQQEFVVGGYTAPKGGRAGFGALLTGVYEPGAGLVYTGRVGTGFDEKAIGDIMERLKPIEAPSPAFVNPPVGRDASGVRWVMPKLVIEVEFAQWTNDGVLRLPSFKGLREDVFAAQVVKERPAPLETDAEAAPGATRLTNPGQVLYPDPGLTKSDIAKYYESVWRLMLPHLRGRPLTLVRCPQGYDKDCFFQKHHGARTPGGIGRVEITERGRTGTYLTVESKEGLLGLVQMGVLEIHTWGCRAPGIECPDRITFDMDPDPALEWERLAEAAFLIHELLQRLGLESFVKSTGGKGLHLVSPLEPCCGWEEARAFAKAVAEYVSRGLPERFTAVMTRPRRAGRIFIDYMRNIRGATAIELYSTRARPGAPVAAPLGWDELARVRPDSFTVNNMMERVESLEKDPWQGYFELRQTITGEMKASLGI